jgi:hypothetical protein
MRNATTAYSSSTDTNLDAYKDLPAQHYMSIRNLVITSPDDSYRDTDGEEYGYMRSALQWHYSGLRDPDTFKRFRSAATYCLNCSDDYSEGDYDPARECFVVVISKGEGEIVGAGDAGARDNVAVTPPAGATPPPYDVVCATPIAQLRELEAKLNVECEQLRQLKATLKRDRTDPST